MTAVEVGEGTARRPLAAVLLGVLGVLGVAAAVLVGLAVPDGRVAPFGMDSGVSLPGLPNLTWGGRDSGSNGDVVVEEGELVPLPDVDAVGRLFAQDRVVQQVGRAGDVGPVGWLRVDGPAVRAEGSGLPAVPVTVWPDAGGVRRFWVEVDVTAYGVWQVRGVQPRN